MTRIKPRTVFTIFVLFMSVALSATIVSAQTKVEGVIKGRDGSKIILQTADSPKLIVLLTDSSDVAQVQGALKARKKKMSMAALVPGLPIKVEGTYDGQESGRHFFVGCIDNRIQAFRKIRADRCDQASACRETEHSDLVRIECDSAEWNLTKPDWIRRVVNLI